MKRVFIAHAMSGDIEGNMAKVTAICREIQSLEVIPIFPSFMTRRYLTPEPKDRELASAHIREYFSSGFVHELWLYGVDITTGMVREIKLADEFGVPVIAKTLQTEALLDDLHLNEDIASAAPLASTLILPRS